MLTVKQVMFFVESALSNKGVYIEDKCVVAQRSHFEVNIYLTNGSVVLLDTDMTDNEIRSAIFRNTKGAK